MPQRECNDATGKMPKRETAKRKLMDCEEKSRISSIRDKFDDNINHMLIANQIPRCAGKRHIGNWRFLEQEG
jgi:hypothetical protein